MDVIIVNRLIQTIEPEPIRESEPEPIRESEAISKSTPTVNPEPMIITQARKKLENWIIGVLGNRIAVGFRQVYNSVELFKILSEHPEYNSIRRVGFSEKRMFHYNYSVALFQFRFNGILINIVVNSKDLEPASEISISSSYPVKQLREVMFHDIRTKLSKMSFFLDYHEACTFVTSKVRSYGLGMQIDFIENPKFSKIRKEMKEIKQKKTINKMKKKQLESERRVELRLYGPNGKPKPLILGDFI